MIVAEIHGPDIRHETNTAPAPTLRKGTGMTEDNAGTTGSRAKHALLGVAIFMFAALLWNAFGSPRAGALPAGARAPCERAVRSYWEAVLHNDYAKALSFTRAVAIPDDRRRGWEMYMRESYGRLGLTRIEAIGPAQADPYGKNGAKVAYRIAGREPLSGDFSLRNDIVPGKREWLISEGF